ncbi:hypothetical protein BD324DRAFT_638074 [Kockovaella imperatae]|uniref:NAD(P)-binding protein n=1 Tax=Kockovaella imperatae TaxID=4999 RepID=A0A1Y1UAC1_9TREE|nr:hypothetical protein BD324DRAFT_638074 [Kockovaella imperatae]ORX34025.1 hypothetical protein BD324DRAFT_638074 [Kockovaella imperatae]
MPTVLITGANRGIGAGFVEGYLAKGYTVIAAARDPSAVKTKDGVIPVKLDVSSQTDALDAVSELRSKHGLTSIDIIIANAGTHGTNQKLKDVPASVMHECWTVNTLGPLLLYQAVYPLIPRTGKFVVISSYRGMIGQQHETLEGAYGHSKAAVNYIVSKLHCEEVFITLALNPGWVQTEMGNRSAQFAGFGEKAPQQIQDVIGEAWREVKAQDKGWTLTSVPGQFLEPMINLIDKSTKNGNSGKFLQW